MDETSERTVSKPPGLVEGVASDIILFEAGDVVSRSRRPRQVRRDGAVVRPTPAGAEAWA